MTDVDQVVADHRMRVDRVSSRPKKVLIVVANPSVSTTLGWPVGFWAAELTHPYYELTERGVEVTVASPDGGKVEMDSLSDPRDPSKWSAEDLVTMGFVNTPGLVQLLEDTPALADLDLDEFDAIMVAGGQSPMFTFREHDVLKSATPVTHVQSGSTVGSAAQGVRTGPCDLPPRTCLARRPRA